MAAGPPPLPARSNTALAMCGLVRPIFRLPYVPLLREQREKGAKLLRAVQEHIPGCKVRRGAEWGRGVRQQLARAEPAAVCWLAGSLPSVKFCRFFRRCASWTTASSSWWSRPRTRLFACPTQFCCCCLQLPLRCRSAVAPHAPPLALTQAPPTRHVPCRAPCTLNDALYDVNSESLAHVSAVRGGKWRLSQCTPQRSGGERRARRALHEGSQGLARAVLHHSTLPVPTRSSPPPSTPGRSSIGKPASVACCSFVQRHWCSGNAPLQAPWLGGLRGALQHASPACCAARAAAPLQQCASPA